MTIHRYYPQCKLCLTSHNAESWTALRFVGWMTDRNADLELRECCGSTISVALRRTIDERFEVPR